MEGAFLGCCCECCCECCAGCCTGCCSSSDPNNNIFIYCCEGSCGIFIYAYTCISESCDLTKSFCCLYMITTYNCLYNINNKYEVPKQTVVIKDVNIFKINTVCIIEVQNNEI